MMMVVRIILDCGNYVTFGMDEAKGRELVRDWRVGKFQANTLGDEAGTWAVRTSSIQAIHLMELEPNTSKPSAVAMPTALTSFGARSGGAV